MFWNRKANVLNNYIISLGIEKKVVIKEFENNIYRFNFAINGKYEYDVHIFVYDFELTRVVIGISRYKKYANLSPLYEKLNTINLKSDIAYFIAKDGEILAAFNFLSIEQTFNPKLLLDSIQTVVRFIDTTAYQDITSAIIDCEKCNTNEKNEQDNKETLRKNVIHNEVTNGYFDDDYDDEKYRRSVEYNDIAEKYGFDDDAIESSPEYWELMNEMDEDDYNDN